MAGSVLHRVLVTTCVLMVLCSTPCLTAPSGTCDMCYIKGLCGSGQCRPLPACGEYSCLCPNGKTGSMCAEDAHVMQNAPVINERLRVKVNNPIDGLDLPLFEVLHQDLNPFHNSFPFGDPTNTTTSAKPATTTPTTTTTTSATIVTSTTASTTVSGNIRNIGTTAAKVLSPRTGISYDPVVAPPTTVAQAGPVSVAPQRPPLPSAPAGSDTSGTVASGSPSTAGQTGQGAAPVARRPPLRIPSLSDALAMAHGSLFQSETPSSTVPSEMITKLQRLYSGGARTGPAPSPAIQSDPTVAAQPAPGSATQPSPAQSVTKGPAAKSALTATSPRPL